ncbi:hypothetical protein [Azospirillum sp. sgz301742]
MTRWRSACSTGAVAAVAGGAVAWDIGALATARLVAAASVLLFVVLEATALTRGSKIMLAACAAVAALAGLLLEAPGAVLLRGLAGAAFVIGLFATLGLLRDAAETSELVQRCGQIMVRQPPGRRYLALTLGSHLIAVILNFGVLTLLGVLVTRGNTLESAGGDERIARIRTQRMMTAVLRGFALMTAWSPLTIAFTVTESAMPGLDWGVLLPLQFVLGLLLVGFGWALDRRAFPRPPLPAQAAPAMEWAPLLGLTALIVGVVAGSVAVAVALSIRPVVGAMMVVPAAAWLWLSAQQWRADGPAVPAVALYRLGGRLLVSIPTFRNEFVIVGGATFFGTVAAALLPAEAAAALISRIPLDPALVMVLLVWGMMAAARYGVPQIVSVTLIGHAVAGLEPLGFHTLVLASGLMGAWGLSACTTPVGAATLCVARLSGVTTRIVAREWNGTFVISGAVLVALWMLALSAVI